jgi:hypothetical protein
MPHEGADDPASAVLIAAALARAADAEALSEEIVLAWSVSPGAELVIDLSGGVRMDETLARALSIATREIEGAGGRVRVLGPTEG